MLVLTRFMPTTTSGAVMKKSFVSLLLLLSTLPAAATQPSGAVYGGSLYLANPAFPAGVTFIGRSAADTHSYSSYVQGSEFILTLINHSSRYTYQSGSPGRNPDGRAHAYVIYNYQGFGTALVAFEDQYGGGDNDFNDALFLVTNVSATPPQLPPPVVQPAYPYPPAAYPYPYPGYPSRWAPSAKTCVPYYKGYPASGCVAW
jgi:hypothetical protein